MDLGNLLPIPLRPLHGVLAAALFRMLKFSLVEICLLLLLVLNFCSRFGLFPGFGCLARLFSLRVAFSPSVALPLLPCGVLTPCHVVERHPFGVCCRSPNWASSA